MANFVQFILEHPVYITTTNDEKYVLDWTWSWATGLMAGPIRVMFYPMSYSVFTFLFFCNRFRLYCCFWGKIREYAIIGLRAILCTGLYFNVTLFASSYSSILSLSVLLRHLCNFYLPTCSVYWCIRVRSRVKESDPVPPMGCDTTKVTTYCDWSRLRTVWWSED